MLRTTMELKTITGKGWGKTAQVVLTGGPTYYGFVLDTRAPGGATYLDPADFRIQLLENGTTRCELSGEDIEMLCDFEKVYRIPGVYHIRLVPKRSKTIDGALIAGMETSPTGNYVLKVVVNNTDSGGLTPDFDLGGHAIVSENLQGRIGDQLAFYMPRIRKTVIDIGKTGKNTIADFLDDADFSVLGMHILDEGKIDSVTVLQGNGSNRMVNVWERPTWLNSLLLREEERAPQADWWHFDPCETGFVIMEKLETAGLKTSLEIEANATGKLECLLYTLEKVDVRPAVAAA